MPAELIPAISIEPAERDQTLVGLAAAYAAAISNPGDNGLAEAEQGLDLYAHELALNRKTDAYSYLMAYLEHQQALGKREIQRLQRRVKGAEATLDRLERTAVLALSSLPEPDAGRPRELRGNTSTLALQLNPAHVEIRDEHAVPARFKVATVTMPAEYFLQLPRAELMAAGALVKIDIRKALIADAIAAGELVPGAELIADYRVVRK